jgi:hypothetical protein
MASPYRWNFKNTLFCFVVRAGRCASYGGSRGQVLDKLGADLRNPLRRVARWPHHEVAFSSPCIY